MQESQQAAAQLLLGRRQARRSFREWCSFLGLEVNQPPAEHHLLVIDKLQEITDSETPRYVIFLMPPGAAKSTYTSMRFPPWFLGRRPGSSILACSYSKDLAARFGRVARNYAEQHATVLGYNLSSDSKAADEWETSTRGRYFCAGVGAGIAGHRADLGLIDDYLGNQEDADSKIVRDKQFEWFVNDFFPRLKPNASIVIIANRRHEDDLVGRLLTHKDNRSPIKPSDWEIIKLPFFAEANDPLKRQPGERLWPQWFTEAMAEKIRKLPSRVRAGLYQQSPRPEDGNYFRLSWLQGYEPQDLPKDLRIYAASDHACTDGDGDSTVFIFGGWDGRRLWILPTCWWETADTGTVVKAMLRIGGRLEPLTWWAEKGHISKSIGPFLRDQMQESGIYLRVQEVTPARAKDVRARCSQGMCELGQVMFPKFAPWWGDAEDQLLTFPGGTHDDWVDAFAHLCRGVFSMVQPDVVRLEPSENPLLHQVLTLASLRQSEKLHHRRQVLILADK